MNLVPPPSGPPPPMGHRLFNPNYSTSTSGSTTSEPNTSNNTRNNTNRFNVFQERDFETPPPPLIFI